MRKIIFVALLCAFIGASAQEDTTVVQCFTFDDITKRRGTFEFPDGDKDYRKVLMSYRLKCDPRTTRDQYDCGEWDYLSYTYIYDYSGEFDSTYRSHALYLLDGANSNSYDLRTSPTYMLMMDSLETEVSNQVNPYIPLNSTTAQNAGPFSALNLQRTQYIYTAAELAGSGLSAGSKIHGIAINVVQPTGGVRELKIAVGHTAQNTITDSSFIEGLRNVYHHMASLTNAGSLHFSFKQPFIWDGTSNVVFEFAHTGASGTTHQVEMESAPQGAALQASTQNGQNVSFANTNSYGVIDRFDELSGNAPRTVEFWAKIDGFNGGGLFQMGATGSASRDFSLRTMGSQNQLRVQLWGADFDVTIPGIANTWHHYAVTYDGSVVKLLVDGVVRGSKAAVLNTNIIDMRIGRWQNAYLQGSMDALRVWKKAVSEADIMDWKGQTDMSQHPDNADLLAQYDFEEKHTPYFENAVNGSHRGVFYNGCQRLSFAPEQLPFDVSVEAERLVILLDTAALVNPLTAMLVLRDTVFDMPKQLVKYNNPAHGIQIPDNDPLHPTIATDTQLVYLGKLFRPIFNPSSGNKIDSTYFASTMTTQNETKIWYSPYARFEIGRFITPYGIGLDLGPDGFEWVFDVTDYTPLLRDSLEISAGNTQELLDLKFYFIEGTPARDVLGIKRIWGQSGSYLYRDLDSDNRLSRSVLPISDKTESLKLKARITGHGHKSDNGNYPHCCEWLDNTHFMYANGQRVSSWKIWQSYECAVNPVFPQGGTWPGAREGWCPGDIVGDVEVELTDYIQGDSIALDYQITPVPTSNQGMGTGNYVMGMHAIQYGKANFKNDVELYDILHPNAHEYNARLGLTCEDAKIIIRNGGSEELSSAKIYYQFEGGVKQCVSWEGSLEFMDTASVQLPIDETWFFTNTGTNMFTVTVEDPNEKADENEYNGVMSVPVRIPDMYEANHKLIFELSTNNQPADNQMRIYDINGNVISELSNLSANTSYRDTLSLEAGCYRMVLTDANHDGLEYWANTSQGSGYTRIWVLNENNVIVNLKPFESDFGARFSHDFSVGSTLGQFAYPDSVKAGDDMCWMTNSIASEDPWKRHLLNIYPNPASEKVELVMQAFSGDVAIEMYSTDGAKILHSTIQMDGGESKSSLNVNNLTKGMYLVKVTDNTGLSVTKKLLIR